MLKADSEEYKMLARWVGEMKPRDFYLTVELGVRGGYGSFVIMDVLKDKNNYHIGIDPYGDIDYKHFDHKEGFYSFWKDEKGEMLVNPDGSPRTPSYSNTMKQEFMSEFKYHDNFTLFQLEDTEYFNCFGQGVPIYHRGQKKVMNVYDFVFFDGPHTTEKVLEEAMFFATRSREGTRFVFDDHQHYQMSVIANALNYFWFHTVEMGETKILLEKGEKNNAVQKYRR